MNIVRALPLLLIVLAFPFVAAAETKFSYFSTNRHLWDQGSDIGLIQYFLNSHGAPLSSEESAGTLNNETSLFGLRTYRALVAFQRAHGLPATGYWGPMTRAVAQKLVEEDAVSTLAPYSESNFSISFPEDWPRRPNVSAAYGTSAFQKRSWQALTGNAWLDVR